MFGTFDKEHQDIVSAYVRGAIVIDLGAGDGQRARILSSMSPRRLVAVDSSPVLNPEWPKKIQLLRMKFSELLEECSGLIDDAEVAYLSWPTNSGLQFEPRDALVRILEKIPMVIYTGSNVDGNACGTEPLFEHFRRRRVEAYAPSKRNTLIVYGKMTDVSRVFVHYEEWAARHSFVPPYEMEMYSSTKDLFEV